VKQGGAAIQKFTPDTPNVVSGINQMLRVLAELGKKPKQAPLGVPYGLGSRERER